MGLGEGGPEVGYGEGRNTHFHGGRPAAASARPQAIKSLKWAISRLRIPRHGEGARVTGGHSSGGAWAGLERDPSGIGLGVEEGVHTRDDRAHFGSDQFTHCGPPFLANRQQH